MTASSRGEHTQLQDPRPGPRTVADLVKGNHVTGNHVKGDHAAQRPAVHRARTGTPQGAATPAATAGRNAGGPERWETGTGPRNAEGAEPRGTGTLRDRNAAGPEHAEERSADPPEATYHAVVPVRAVDRNDERSDGADEDDPPARERYPLIDTPRFANEEICLQDFLETAKYGDYALQHVLIVRAMNVAFVWLFTNTIARITFAVVWSVASFHRAIWVYGILFVIAQAAPVVPALVVVNWTATTWGWIGGGVLVFGVATAIAAVTERRRERRR